MRAPATKQTATEVSRDISKREKKGRVIGLPLGTVKASRFRRSHGNGKNGKNFDPDLNGFSPSSTHIVHRTNVEGNKAKIPITSRLFDRTWIEFHELDPDERKIRRMKNKQRKLLRSRKNRRQHGRSVRVAN